MPWWYPFGCIAFIVGGILIFLKPEWLWALTEQWKSYAADGPSDFYILSTKISGVLFTVFGVVALLLPLFLIDGSGFAFSQNNSIRMVPPARGPPCGCCFAFVTLFW